MFERAGIRFVGVIITAGHGETHPGGNYRHVPKITLISHVQALLHAGHLKIRQDLPEADNLVRELQDFRVNYSASGFMSFNARDGKHDDLVLALAVAVWCALRQRTGSESWDEYLDDWSKRRPAAVADMDDIRAPGPAFGWNLSSEPLVTIKVPPPVDHEGGIYINGRLYGSRRLGHEVVAEVGRADAAWLLSRSQPWRDLQNKALVAELLGEDLSDDDARPVVYRNETEEDPIGGAL
jgi:hypothetical protein